MKKILALLLCFSFCFSVALAKETKFKYGKIIYPTQIVLPKALEKKAKKEGFTPKIDPPVIAYFVEDLTADNEKIMRAFLDNGYAIAVMETKGQFPDNVINAKAAIRFLKKNASKFDIDSGKVGVWGGETAAFVALTPFQEQFEDYSIVPRGESSRVMAALLISPFSKEKLPRLDDFTNYANPSAAYTFILNGKYNRHSPAKKADAFVKKLRDAVGDNNVALLKTDTPAGKQIEITDDITKRIIDFFNKKLRKD
ncbi:MAG: hypothetical protein J6O04_01300 [Selenomonadaceae bacterium]|nr:hypothetical protein [Selenomonadaceae bacterium]